MEENEKEKGFGTSELNRNGMTFTVGPTAGAAGSDPWEKAVGDYPVGTRLHGKVVNFKPYGFFVETDQGFFGLVHGSQVVGWNWRKRFDEVFRLGQEVEVEVTKVDVEAHRMAFSYTMPDDLPSPAAEEPAEEPPLTNAEIARKWTDEHAEQSGQAFAWLKAELEDGPIYGLLAGTLSDRFDVPVPVSAWIRQFPEFTCLSGKGDNPKGLPAVALAGRETDAAYWERFKAKVADLSEGRTREAEEAAKYGSVAAKLSALAFPGSKWISDWAALAGELAAAGDAFGEADTVERLVIPFFGELGWDVAPGRVRPVVLARRGEHGEVDLKFFVGESGRERLALAVVCDRAGTAFGSLRNVGDDPAAPVRKNVVERVLGGANQLHDLDEGFARVVWTSGCEWIVFTEEALRRRVGILSDRSGEKILDETAAEDDNAYFRRLVLPSEGGALEKLAFFAEIRNLLGREKF